MSGCVVLPCALIALVCCAQPVRAQAERLVQWRAPKACPTESEVSSRVQRWLGPASARSEPQDVTGVAEVREVPDGFALAFTLRSASGTQHEQLISERCETLARVVALKLAVAIDPGAVVREVTPPSPSSVSTATPSPPLLIGLHAALGLDLGALPRAFPLVRLGASLSRGWLRTEVEGRYGFTRVEDGDMQAVGTRLDLLAIAARACAVPRLGTLGFPLCTGLEVGRLRGRGFGVRAETSSQRWAAALLGGAMHVPLRRRLEFLVSVETAFALTQPRYHIENVGQIYRAPRLATRAWLGLEVRLE